ncbi:MAG: DUF1700 domain-containing protein [Candidatus Izimaplasma sp.]|nr:DUF1700 domain-containing protein [Candidatus Izimaplasma bacterium]
MNKNEYLKKLESYLKEYDFDDDSISEIIEEYDMIIDEAQENNIYDEVLEERIGTPKEIAKNLKNTGVFKRAKENKIVAISPFVALILFFVLGYGFGYWHPGWLVFLLIPLTAILSERKVNTKSSIIELTPFIALLIFLIIGFSLDVWHPTWTVFFIIPAVGIIGENSKHKIFTAISFILIPLVYVLSYYFFPFKYNWFIFLLLFLPIYYGRWITFKVNSERNERLEKQAGVFLFLLATTYIVLGTIFGIWHPLWVIFLLFPMYAIYASKKELNFKEKIPLVAYTPFIAAILFFLAGYFFDGYHWSWLFFLIIPITAILKE